MSNKTICDVVTLTWNNLKVTKQFVKSYIDSTILSTRLIIIDNGSNDGTPEYLSSLSNAGNCIFEAALNKQNKGFVRGMNQGIALSDAPYICLANNDLIFTKGWLEEIISLFDGRKDIGILNPNSNNLGVRPPEGISLDNFAKDLRNKYRGIFVEMPFCIGFCLCIRRDVIDKVGGLSEEFYPMLFEDSDFSMKTQDAGYLIGMAKASYVWHEEHASIKEIGYERENIFLKSKRTFIKKWGKILRIAWVFDDYADLQKNLGKAVETAKGGNYLWLFCRGLSDKREDIFKKADLTEHSGIGFVGFKNMLDLVWKILKKKKKYDVIIGGDRFTRGIFSGLGYNVLYVSEFSQIEKLKAYADA